MERSQLFQSFSPKVKTARCATIAVLAVIASAVGSPGAATPSSPTGVVNVSVEHTASGFTLVRGGQPYFIRGVGGDASRTLLKSNGGDSFRTWGSDTLDNDLKDAQSNGLTVAAGIWLGHESQGFSYSDPAQIQSQRDMVRQIVTQYRNSPSLLIWSLGNEMEGNGSNPAIWQEVEYLAKMVKALDPHHPVMTVICEPIDKKIAELATYCPDIDIVGINAYASAPTVAQRYLAAGGTRPYILTEFGTPGQWEQPSTSWGASIEMTSTAKAAWYKKAYVTTVKGQPCCLGSYAFLWGTKQEATATWYGMLLPDGDQLAAADTMSSLWTGKEPATSAPVINSFTISGQNTVAPGDTVHVSLDASDPQGAELQYLWVVRTDRKAVANGGAAEAALDDVPGVIQWTSKAGAEIKAPSEPGSYRVFVYLRNSHQKAAVANVPFLVSSTTATTSDGSDVNPLLQTASTEAAPPAKATLPYTIYSGIGKTSTVFIPSGYMGNTGSIAMDEHFTGVHGPGGGACMKATYSATDNWAGVVWQAPANDWGTQPGGLNLTGAKKLSFWARGANGGEVVTFKFGLLGNDKPYHDSSSGDLTNVTLTNGWQQYSIDLTGKNLKRIKTGFAWIVAGTGKPTTFYIDNITYE